MAEAESEAMRLLDEFMEAFNSRDLKAHAATFNYPSVRIASGRVIVLDGPNSHPVGMFDWLAAQGGITALGITARSFMPRRTRSISTPASLAIGKTAVRSARTTRSTSSPSRPAIGVFRLVQASRLDQGNVLARNLGCG